MAGAGHCSYADRSRLQLIDVQQRPRSCNSRELYPAFFREAAGCLSAKPLLHINGSSLRGQLARVEEAWMGLGPRCRGIPAGCYVPGSGRLPPTPQLTASLRLILAQCLGARLDAPAPLRPVQVLVIDRPYTSNRQVAVTGVGRVGPCPDRLVGPQSAALPAGLGCAPEHIGGSHCLAVHAGTF